MSQLSLTLERLAPPPLPVSAAAQMDQLAAALRTCAAAIATASAQLEATMGDHQGRRSRYAQLRNTIDHSQQMLRLAERVPRGRHAGHRGFARAVAELRRAVGDGIATKSVCYRHVAARVW